MSTRSAQCIRSSRLYLTLLLSALATHASGQTTPNSSHSDAIVRKLLNQPSGTLADITLADGTVRTSANIIRVTDSFVALRESATPCENIALANVAKVKWVPLKAAKIPGEGLSPGEWWVVPLMPIFLAFDVTTRLKESRRPMLGSWESVSARPDGRVDRVQLRYGNNIGTVLVRDGWVYQESAFIRTGRYHAEKGALHLEYDHTGAPAEDLNIRFECDQLSAEAPNPIHLTLIRDRQDRAYPPLVGRWRTESQGDGTVWDFHGDGTVQIEKLAGIRKGTFDRKKQGKLRVNWEHPSGGPYDLEWKVRLSMGHLFITTDSGSTEYRRRSELGYSQAPFW